MPNETSSRQVKVLAYLIHVHIDYSQGVIAGYKTCININNLTFYSGIWNHIAENMHLTIVNANKNNKGIS